LLEELSNDENGRVTGSQWPWLGLSCVRGNSHAQFLEGWGRVTVPGYSANGDHYTAAFNSFLLMCFQLHLGEVTFW
jgi:hypothetical protein